MGLFPKDSSLKKVIISRMVQEAKCRITQKIYKEGWSGGISPTWISLLLNAPRAWCNGIGRYTLLRWTVNQDYDVWLSMRGTRHEQRCGSCGLPGDSFPHVFFLLGAAWVRSWAERPSVSYTKVSAVSLGLANSCNYTK